MKKLLIIILLLCTCCVSYAQDTVRRTDPWYYFETQDTLGWISGSYSMFSMWYTVPFENGNMTLIKPWLSLDSSKYLYGVAITAYNFPEDPDRLMISPMLGLHRTMGAYTSTESHLCLFDTLTVDNTMKKCWFEYDTEFENRYNTTVSKPRTEVVPTTEFYFDTPYCIDSLPDTIFTSILWREENRQRYLQWMPYSWTLDNSDSLWFTPIKVWSLHVATSYWSKQTDFQNLLYYNDAALDFFGPMFPIVKLRCTAPRLSFVGLGGDTAQVTWWQAEAGEAYQLSLATYGGDPDAGLLVTPTDSFYTFTGLQPDSIYQVWARKACRYTTAGYDTLVWSDWGRPLTFRASVGISEVDDMTLQVAARDGGIAVQGLAAGERAEVYDMQGRRVASLAVDGVTPPLPQGVYLLRTTAHSRARKVVLLR